MKREKKQTSTLIRFYGSEACVIEWRKRVLETTGRAGTVVERVNPDYRRFEFEVPLTGKDRDDLMGLWHSVAFPGNAEYASPTGIEFLWNDCIAFQEIKTP